MSGFIHMLLACEDRKCLVVGGGTIAQRKARLLLDAQANVTIISPSLTQALLAWHQDGLIQWEQRDFVEGDTSGYWIVYAATNNEIINKNIADEAHQNDIPVNLVSDAEQGSFIHPAVVKRGRLTIAVSTLGASPGMATSISNTLAAQYGVEYEAYFDVIYRIRSAIKNSVVSLERRGRLLKRLAELHILDDIRQGTYIEWSKEEIQIWISQNEEE
ncbi:precorrin-2 dehydrogenase/sirohydrochlorin ferrochelatase family protein [Paenibacillus sp. CMAA1364]